MNKKMYLNALPFLELASTISYGGNEQVNILKGLCYLHSGNLKQAENIILKGYKSNKNSNGYNHNLALLYFTKGELVKARSYINRAVELDKDFIRSYYLSALIYEKEGNYNQAIKETNYAIEKTSFIPEKKKMRETLKRVKKLKVEKAIHH